MSELSGYRALVTGASAGIGAEIARSLARRGAALVLTARRGPELEALAAELRAAHAVAVEVLDADLAAPDAARPLWERATAGGAVDILVNNAGFGHFRPFGEVAVTREAEMLRLNILTVVELGHAFVTAHRDRPPGRPAYLLNVASMAAWQPVPNFSTYAASKVFVRNWSEALTLEQRGTGIRVTCLCPGGTVTEFHATAGAGNYGRLANASMLPAATVAEAGVRALLRGKKTVVTGLLNKLSCFLTGLAPRWLSSRASTWVMGKPRRDALPARTATEKTS
ncbi:MAG: SDR family NAD(P)-dependent oxidoreductase [Kofleriaceae bacterium]|nr:SDR family NAD(P)-dependent oxidoreductase [Kofleriaceae bacterium]